jgi:hypothetical protein
MFRRLDVLTWGEMVRDDDNFLPVKYSIQSDSLQLLNRQRNRDIISHRDIDLDRKSVV